MNRNAGHSGDPIERLKLHLMGMGEWSEARHEELSGELDAQVSAEWKEALTFGTLNDGPRLDRDLMFEDVFKELPEHLRRQRELLRAELAASLLRARYGADEHDPGAQLGHGCGHGA